MADGVDHIDIYADVGEEFNQVRAARGRGLSAPLRSLARLGSRAACRALSAAAAPPPLFGRSRRRRARGCAGLGRARPHGPAAGAGGGPGWAESAPGAHTAPLPGAERLPSLPRFSACRRPSFLSAFPPQGPLQRALPRRLGRRDPPGCGGESGPFPPAAEGKRCHCSQVESKSRRAVAASRPRFAGEAELARLYSAALEKVSCFLYFLFFCFSYSLLSFIFKSGASLFQRTSSYFVEEMRMK